MHPFQKKQSGGFSLLEVLVALMIFVSMAVVLGGTYLNILTAYDVAARSVTRNDDLRFARAALLAQADLEAVEAGEAFEGTDGRRVKWKAVVEPTNIADLFKVTFMCEFSGGGLTQAQTVEETFRVLRPTWSQPVERDKLRNESRNRINQIQQEQGNNFK